MEIVLYIICVAYGCGIGYCLHGMYECELRLRRNSKVSEFRRYVLKLSGEFERANLDTWEGYHRHYFKLPSYEEMLEDGKPLELSSYFLPNEVLELFTSKPSGIYNDNF